MGTSRLRHPSADVVFSADGKTLISATPSEVRIWDVATGKELRRKGLHPGRFGDGRGWSSRLSPDGRLLAVQESEAGRRLVTGAVHVLSTASGKELCRFPVGAESLWRFSFSPDGKILGVPSRDKDGAYSIHLWDVPAGKLRSVVKHKFSISTPVFSPDGKLLAVSENGNSTLHLWDTATGREVRSVRASPFCLAFSPDGRTLAGETGVAVAGGLKGKVTLWDVATLNEEATFDVSTTGNDLIFSPDGTLLALAGRDGLVLCDVATRRELRRLPESKDYYQVTFSPDSKTLACINGGEIHLWDVATSKRLHHRPGHDSWVHSVASSTDGKLVASACSRDGSVRLWDAATGKPLGVLEGHDSFDPRLDSAPYVCSCRFSADGNWVVAMSGGREGFLRLWEASTGRKLRRFVCKDPSCGHRDAPEMSACNLSPDGKRLAAISLASNGSPRALVHIWDTATGKVVSCRELRVDYHSRPISATGFESSFDFHSCFTPDGKSVTVRTEKGLVVEETITGRQLATVPGSLGSPAAFSPDGRLLAASVSKPRGTPFDGYEVQGMVLAEVATGKEVYRLVAGDVKLLDFSSDGRVLVTANKEALDVWDVATGKRLFRRPWPTDLASRSDRLPVESLALMPGGRAAVTGLDDGTILVWDLEPATWPAIGETKRLHRKDVDELWTDLMSADARKAHRAIYTLAAAPAQAVPFLAEHLQSAAKVNSKRVERLLADLNSDQFAVREAAMRGLADLGEQVEPNLRRTLERKPPAEVWRRVEALLTAPRPLPAGELLRTLRAIRVLERVGTREARQVLHKLAGGAPDRPTREAREALERLAR
jgi:WD40 repeat protein